MTIETDALIVGAGPCGLFQVFELGLLGVRAHVVESMPMVGGQCAELYPDKPIYDIPGYPVIGAQELIDRLVEQIQPFDPQFHLGEEVRELARESGGRYRVKTSRDTEFLARSIVIAGGVGSFQPRRLKVDGCQALEGDQIHYRVRDVAGFSDQRLVVLGGGDSALDWALELEGQARSIAVVHRRGQYRAHAASVERLEALCDGDRVQALQGFVTDLNIENDRLQEVVFRNSDGESFTLAADQLLVFWGLHPNLGPIADWGLDLDRRQIRVGTEDFQTDRDGIFAVGDINIYPGKRKLILSGFHEAALAAYGIRHYLYPEEKIHLQYTTTSTKMHERLGL
jgi:thioredoxin reductase (NADPH)